MLIKGMTMPTTGLYFVSVDNTDDSDRTIVTVERMLGSSDVRQIIGSFELVPVPPHGRLIDADELRGWYDFHSYDVDDDDFLTEEEFDKLMVATAVVRQNIDDAPTIIEAEEAYT